MMCLFQIEFVVGTKRSSGADGASECSEMTVVQSWGL